MQCDVMVGVSTEQNTTNLVPFVQFHGQRLLLAETTEAKQRQWSAGLGQVVHNHPGKECDIVPIGSGDSLAETTRILKQRTDPLPSICWNFGGGQKIQQIALFQLFMERLRQGKGDWACYSEPRSRSTHVMTAGADGQLHNTARPTDAPLSLEEILLTFGNAINKASEHCLWSRWTSAQPADPSPLTGEQAAWFDDAHKRRQMFRYHDLDETPPPAEAIIYPGDFRKLGDFFEKLVQYRVALIIGEQPEKHCVNEVWANVRVRPLAQTVERAEYDVVLVTNFGTIIPLDAKSLKFSAKEEHARLHNLQQASGRYTTIWPVFPYFREDLHRDSLLQQDDKGWRQLLRMPFELAQRGSVMLTLSEQGLTSFFVRQGRKNRVSVSDTPTDTSMEIFTLESLVDRLQLARN